MRACAWFCGGLAALFATACSSDGPLVLDSSFALYGPLPWAHSAKGRDTTTPPCTISIGNVVDGRADTKSMGNLGSRSVSHQNPIGWIRSGLEALTEDRQLHVVATPDVGDGFVLNVTILKAYLQGLPAAMNATVVLRVRYTRDGAPAGENTYRGVATGMNWASGDGEARDALNQALRDVLEAVHGDLRARCDQSPALPAAQDVAAAN